MLVKPFGEIDPDNLKDYYSGEITTSNRAINVDLNFEETKISKDNLLKVSNFIENINVFLEQAMKYISTDYDLGEDSETAQEYLSHHLEYMGAEEVNSLFGTKEVNKQLYFSKLQVYRVGFYPEESEDFVIIDIQFPEEVTNYLMAVTLDSKFELSFIGMDS